MIRRYPLGGIEVPAGLIKYNLPHEAAPTGMIQTTLNKWLPHETVVRLAVWERVRFCMNYIRWTGEFMYPGIPAFDAVVTELRICRRWLRGEPIPNWW